MKPLEFEKKMSDLVRSERKITGEVLRMINLAFDRKHDLEMGYSSLFDWLVKGHGYSESAAQRRIQAAKLLRSVPEISGKIESGEVNLTTLSRTQTFLTAQEKVSGEKVSPEDKSKLLRLIEKKTSKQAEKVLTALLPEASLEIQTAAQTRLEGALNLSEEGLKDLDRAKEILSHVIPDGDTCSLVEYLLKDFLKRKDPLRRPITSHEKGKQSSAQKNQVTAGTAKPCVEIALPKEGAKARTPSGLRKAIPARTKRAVFQKTQGTCEYRSPLTGKVCGSAYQIQLDHVHPHSLGGSDEPENLRALCGAHNRYRAEKTFGKRPSGP